MSDNSFYVDYMTRTYNRFINSQIAGTQVKGVMGFKDHVEAGTKAAAEAEEISAEKIAGAAAKTKALSTESMTPAEYKQYIYNKISQIPLHPSQKLCSISITITDEGFAAMQKDPEYEKWVLDTLKSNFGFYNPWTEICGGSFSVHHFGAAKEEYHGESWYMGYRGGKGSALFDEEAEEGFWVKRAKRLKKYLKQQQEIADENKIMKRIYREAAIRRGDYDSLFDREGMIQTLNPANLLLIPDGPGSED